MYDLASDFEQRPAAGVGQEQELPSAFHDMDRKQTGSASAADEPASLPSESNNSPFAIGPQTNNGQALVYNIVNCANVHIFSPSTDNAVCENTSSETSDYEINEVSQEPQ